MAKARISRVKIKINLVDWRLKPPAGIVTGSCGLRGFLFKEVEYGVNNSL